MIDRRSTLKTIVTSVCLPATIGIANPEFRSTEYSSDDLRDLEIIDCHTHFYDPSRKQGVPWPPKNSKLYKTVLPKDLRALKKHRPVTGTVIVEASKWVEDNQWLLDLAKNDPFIVGIVGRLTPGDEDFLKQIDRFAKNQLFRGIRVDYRILQKLLTEKKWAGMKRMDELDLELDVNGSPDLLAVVDKAAKQIPEMRFLINHLANTPIADKTPPKKWVTDMNRVAKNKNVFCKVSALVEGASRGRDKPPSELEFYRGYLDVVWEAFGEDRLIYGSNWPVSDLFADYSTLQRIVFEYFSEKGESATRKFFAHNAKKAYRYVNRKPE